VADLDTAHSTEPSGPLFGGELEIRESKPWWLVEGPPPGITKERWPSEARSPSWLKLMAECALKHSLRYRHKREDPPSQQARVGNVIHGALLCAAVRRARASKLKSIPETASTEELLHLLEHVHVCCGTLIRDGHRDGCRPGPLDPGLLEEAREKLRKIGPISFPHVLAAEKLCMIHLTPSTRIAGYLDLLSVDEGTSADPRMLTITDYKTGPGSVPDEEELFYDPQACTYLCAVKNAYPRARVRFRLWNVGQDEETWVEWSSRLEQTFFANARMLLNRWDAGDEQASVAEHCAYCFNRLECGAYKIKLDRDRVAIPPESVEALDMHSLVQLYRESAIGADLHEQRRKDCGKLLLERIPAPQRQYRSGHLLAVRKFQPHKSLSTSPAEVITDVAHEASVNPLELLNAVGDVSIRALEAWIKSLPASRRDAAMTKFLSHVSRGWTRAVINVREAKDKAVF
jgi:hypothetical protein